MSDPLPRVERPDAKDPCPQCGHPIGDHYNDDGDPPPAPQLCHTWIGRTVTDPAGDYCPCSGGGLPA